MHINQIKSDCIGKTDNFFHGYIRHIRDIVKLWRLLYDFDDAVDDVDDDVRLLENI